MVLPIYTYGQPVLRQVAVDIDASYPDLAQLVADMWETLRESDGIGLAAPQVGRSIRLSVIDLDPLADDLPEYSGFRRVYINPHILELDESGTDVGEEGCLSLPGIHEKVRRATRILLRYQDEDFNVHEEWVEGYLARVMQHEFDHLDGRVFTDHVRGLRRQLVAAKLRDIARGDFTCSYKVKPPTARTGDKKGRR